MSPNQTPILLLLHRRSQRNRILPRWVLMSCWTIGFSSPIVSFANAYSRTNSGSPKSKIHDQQKRSASCLCHLHSLAACHVSSTGNCYVTTNRHWTGAPGTGWAAFSFKGKKLLTSLLIGSKTRPSFADRCCCRPWQWVTSAYDLFNIVVTWPTANGNRPCTTK